MGHSERDTPQDLRPSYQSLHSLDVVGIDGCNLSGWRRHAAIDRCAIQRDCVCERVAFWSRGDQGRESSQIVVFAVEPTSTAIYAMDYGEAVQREVAAIQESDNSRTFKLALVSMSAVRPEEIRVYTEE